MTRFGRGTLAGLAAGFAVLILLVAATAWLVLRTQEAGRLASHSLQVELAANEVRTLTERAETTQRGFLLDPDEEFAKAFEATAAELDPALLKLKLLVADNLNQVARVETLEAAARAHVDFLRAEIAERRAQPSLPPSFSLARNLPPVRQVREEIAALIERERALLAERSARETLNLRWSVAVIALALPALLALAGATIWLTRRNVRALADTSERLRLLNDDLEGAVEERTAELMRANEEIQRFAYIVSHDLRSPLVNIMGFTGELEAATGLLGDMVRRVETEAPELLNEEARLAAAEDLPEAIGFIRASTAKMDRLINAILRLSREGRRTINPEPIDMGELVRGVEASLQHRLTETGAHVEIGPLPTVVSDRVGVEQIVSNLMENAVKYLKPGRAGLIRVRGHVEGERAVFEFEDNGRGIDPKDHERIFDLFRRSGPQDQPGEGIGLAHVRAQAYRLGGTISCRSALDEGATFRLSMRRITPSGETSRPS
ncbi:ATP-binding protein [Aureimonas sp. AU4]|uniref:sensor histidine kinase n=1 Tax=Aureimonas sp. AU4 TaxID=1638163 RepID=UPI000784590D|nr:sensor histidine kinase [Aureimonas sp. AU4]